MGQLPGQLPGQRGCRPNRLCITLLFVSENCLLLPEELCLRLPRKCGTDQETNLHMVAVGWAMSLSRLTRCATAIPTALSLHPVCHTLSRGAFVSGSGSPGPQTREDSKTDRDVLIHTCHRSIKERQIHFSPGTKMLSF